MAFLITELNEQVEYLTEEVGGKKSWCIEGIYLQAGIKNRNGRYYPPEIMEREALRYIKEKVSNSCAYGELGHPDGPQLNMERISHHITSLRKDGHNWVGKSRLIDEGYGKIARGILEAGGKLGVSSRGMGNLKEESKGMVVQPDFHLAVGADIVGDPSAPSAWVNGIMEGVEWVRTESGAYTQQRLSEIQAAVHETPKAMLTEVKFQLFEKYVEDLKETQMVDMLVKTAKVSPAVAKDAVRKAKIKTRLANPGTQHDDRYVWSTAREILGIGGR
jgi:hypothetical protein